MLKINDGHFTFICDKCNAETYKTKWHANAMFSHKLFGYEHFVLSSTELDLCSSCLKKTTASELIDLCKMQQEKEKIKTKKRRLEEQERLKSWIKLGTGEK